MKALITLLIVGSSSVALARPITVDHRDEFATDNVIVRDHRYAQPPLQAPPAPPQSYDYGVEDDRFDGRLEGEYRFEQRMRLRRPVLLAQDVSLMRQWNRDHRPMRIDIDHRIGGLKTIKLERNTGRMYVDSILIDYADGHRQTVEVSQMLSARQPSLLIQLEHGAVTGMYVYGSTMRGRATFDVIGLRR
jgi:hypothetical protein